MGSLGTLYSTMKLWLEFLLRNGNVNWMKKTNGGHENLETCLKEKWLGKNLYMCNGAIHYCKCQR
jgi:hypothetical protein